MQASQFNRGSVTKTGVSAICAYYQDKGCFPKGWDQLSSDGYLNSKFTAEGNKFRAYPALEFQIISDGGQCRLRTSSNGQLATRTDLRIELMEFSVLKGDKAGRLSHALPLITDLISHQKEARDLPLNIVEKKTEFPSDTVFKALTDLRRAVGPVSYFRPMERPDAFALYFHVDREAVFGSEFAVPCEICVYCFVREGDWHLMVLRREDGSLEVKCQER